MSAALGDRVSIRAAVAQDGAQVGEVFALACTHAYGGILPAGFMRRYRPEPQAATWADRIEALDDGHSIQVAALDDVIVGFAHVGPADDSSEAPEGAGEVFHLFVRPALARRSVGSSLMTACLAWFAARRCRQAVLWVFEENSTARHFYESVGWRFGGTARLEPWLRTMGIDVMECRYDIRVPSRTG